MSIVQYLRRGRLSTIVFAVIASEIAMWHIVEHINRLRVSSTWLLVYDAFFGVILVASLYLLAGDQPKRRTIASWSATGLVVGFIAGAIVDWPATFVAYGAEMTAHRWDLQYGRGGIATVVEGAGFVSFGMLSWVAGALSGLIVGILRSAKVSGSGAPGDRQGASGESPLR